MLFLPELSLSKHLLMPPRSRIRYPCGQDCTGRAVPYPLIWGWILLSEFFLFLRRLFFLINCFCPPLNMKFILSQDFFSFYSLARHDIATRPVLLDLKLFWTLATSTKKELF